MTDVGSVIYDKDATFLEVGASNKDSLTQYGIEDKRTPLLTELKSMQIDESGATNHGLQLLKDAPMITASDSSFEMQLMT